MGAKYEEEDAEAHQAESESNGDSKQQKLEAKSRSEKKHQQKAGSKAESKESSKSEQKSAQQDGPSVQQVINMIGGIRLPTEGSLSKRTGKLVNEYVLTVLHNYVPPDCYDAAVEPLGEDHVVVLSGGRGFGKRTSAVALLREVTAGPLVVLSPAVSLDQLANRVYETGHGYVVFDRKKSDKDTDFDWHTVRDQVRDANAWLVVTTDETQELGMVVEVDWQQPDIRRLTTRWLGADAPDLVTEVAAGLPDEYSMAEVVALLQSIATGTDVTKALKELDIGSRHDVHAWFENDPTRRQVLEVTAMAFLGGCKQRTFETHLAGLEEHLARMMPVPEADDDSPRLPKEESMPQRRRDMANVHGLIGVAESTVEGMFRQILEFRKAGYRRCVLAELWHREHTAFWDAVREWLAAIIASSSMTVQEHTERIAVGLADLAAVAYDEVEDSYLEPWSARNSLGVERMAATYVLSAMCYDEVTAPVALRTAIRWATRGVAAQRSTATLAFGGVIGISYPDEAVNRLWQLAVAAADNATTTPVLALASLFDRLCKEQVDAGIVLVLLDKRWQQYQPPNGHRGLRALTLRATAEVLCTRRNGISAILQYLHDHPERIGVAGSLWAITACHRTLRNRVLSAITDGLGDLARISDHASDTVASLGNALAQALNPKERHLLVHDLLAVREQQKRMLRQRPGSSAVEREQEIDKLIGVLLEPCRNTVLERKI
jgi:hypothetical protein